MKRPDSDLFGPISVPRLYGRWTVGVLALTVLLLAAASSWAASPEEVRTRELHSGWTLSQAGKQECIPAAVPGTVHTDLLAAGRIPDPFHGDNERRVQWIDKEDWVYRTHFTLDKNEAARSCTELVFDGLDTYADVFVNGTKVLAADNMFRTWTADVESCVQEGENELKIYFHSPIKVSLPLYDASPYVLFCSPDDSEMGGLGQKKVGMYNRKVPSHFGWDWGPRMVTSGIWRPVRLRLWDELRIGDVQYVQDTLCDRFAGLRARVEVVSAGAKETDVSVTADGKKLGGKSVRLEKGINTVEIPLRIDRPRRWWPNGMGEQPLYKMETTLSSGGERIDGDRRNIGLRTVRLVQEPDQWGRSFYFEVNGIPMFAKGANLIPTDNFLPRTDGAKYSDLVGAAAAANMNMLRVWGGGTYEDDRFYDACDSLGILVWQDFLFACSMYPTSDAFRESVRAEAEDNVRRLRNHPSLALWCGNNEITQAWYRWGWSQRKDVSQEHRDEMWTGYKKIFFDMLPEVVAQNDPGRFYWPSSPGSAFTEPQNLTSGDVHYWQYREKRLPVTAFREQTGRFMSEFGINSSPTEKTFVKYLDPKDLDFASPVLRQHFKSKFEPDLTNYYIAHYYDGKEDFRSGVYMGQVFQADALKYIITQHRINRPFCMGSLYWQLNDCWPGASWSTIDCLGEWKPAHYAVRRVFAADMVGCDLTADSLRVFGVTDRMKPVNTHLTARLLDFTGRELYRLDMKAPLKANASTLLVEKTRSEVLAGHDPKKVVLHLSLTSGGREIVSDNLFFADPKELDMPRATIRSRVVGTARGFDLELTADRCARYVRVEVPGDGVFISDNCFDLLPGQTRRVSVRGADPSASVRITQYSDYKK